MEMMLTCRLTRSRYASNSAPGNESDPTRATSKNVTLSLSLSFLPLLLYASSLRAR